jgi:hypothetical protein
MAAHEAEIEDSPIGPPIRTLTEKGEWTGTATELKERLEALVLKKVIESKRWPRRPKGMSGMLRRLAPALRAVGFTVDFGREGAEGTRTIAIIPPHPVSRRKNASGASGNAPKPSVAPDLTGDGRMSAMRQGCVSDRPRCVSDPSRCVSDASVPDAVKDRVTDASDAPDTLFPLSSGDPPF